MRTTNIPTMSICENCKIKQKRGRLGARARTRLDHSYAFIPPGCLPFVIEDPWVEIRGYSSASEPLGDPGRGMKPRRDTRCDLRPLLRHPVKRSASANPALEISAPIQVLIRDFGAHRHSLCWCVLSIAHMLSGIVCKISLDVRPFG